MGQEVEASHFERADFTRFEKHLRRETEILQEWFENHRFARTRPVGGLELEGWLIRPDGQPEPANEAFLERMDDRDVVAELSKFNFELNVDPQPVAGPGLRLLETEMREAWERSRRTAQAMGLDIVAIGILPTVRDSDLCPANMSESVRYRALNEQLLRIRRGVPVELEIVGHEHVCSTHLDVMLEAAATSFQAHLQVTERAAARSLNASSIVSAPLVAIAANSPFLFGQQVWEETRIPVFEQALAQGGPVRRVTFGSGYVDSLEDTSVENLDRYAPLLPAEMEQPEERLPHLRLHNGTIWRWNRPLIGFEADGTPHLRIEQRVMAAGPTPLDMAANMAFFQGLVAWLVMEPHAPELRLPFSEARQNFYEAARLGMAAAVDWYDGKRWRLSRLIQDVLLPQARAGLRALQVDDEDADRYLGVIEQRADRGATGAAFQKEFVERYGPDFGALVRAYRDREASGEPVHTWTL